VESLFPHTYLHSHEIYWWQIIGLCVPIDRLGDVTLTYVRVRSN